MLVGAPAQQVPVGTVAQVDAVAGEDRQDGVDIAETVHAIGFQSDRRERLGCRPVDQVAIGWAMIGVGLPIAASACINAIGAGSLPWTAVLFGVSGLFIGPFAAALFVARNRLAPASVRTQVFTVGAGLKVTASALGAALIGFATHLPVSSQLLLVASSPLIAGILGVLLLRRCDGMRTGTPSGVG